MIKNATPFIAAKHYTRNLNVYELKTLFALTKFDIECRIYIPNWVRTGD